jgi:hypothetical protein
MGKAAASVRMLGQHLSDEVLNKERHGEELQPSGRQGQYRPNAILIMEIAVAELQPAGC